MKIACVSFRTSLFCFMLAVTLPLSLQAATITVTSGADTGGTCPGAGCTLRQAIAVSAAGGTIDFAAGLTAVTLTSGELAIDKNLTIRGPGANLLSVQRSYAPEIPKFRIFNVGGSTVTFSDIAIQNGYADFLNNGGGIYANQVNLTIIRSTISNNHAGDFGGGIRHYLGQLTIVNSTISDNSANYGGGIFISSLAGTANITNSTISDNSADTWGGGVYNTYSPLTIANSTISGNSSSGVGAAGGGGGGIYNYQEGLTITNSTISGNSSSVDGGGINNANGNLTIFSSTVSGNNSGAIRNGGGIFSNGTLSLTSTTVTGNFANQGGGINVSGGTLTIDNSIIALNTATLSFPDLYVFDMIYFSQGHNLIGIEQIGVSPQVGDQFGTLASPIDPKLGSLDNNGGPTKTHALLSGSTAIEGGKSPSSNLDQRGLARPVDSLGIPNATGGDGSDIGAYEVQADVLPGCNAIPNVVTNNNDGPAGSLRQVIGAVCAGSTITFAPNVTGQINLTLGELVLGKSVTIVGPGANVLSVRRGDAAGAFRILNVTPASVIANLSGLTIAKGIGVPSGGGIHNSGTLNLTRVAVSGNTATNGGGIYNNSGTLNITDSTVSGNVLGLIIAGSGGGIFNFGGALNVTNSTISGNTAHGNSNIDGGGGILTNVGTVSLNSSTITGNIGDLGGGIRNINGGTVRSKNTIIALNTSASGPDVNGPLTSENFNFIGNSSSATITPAQFSDQIGTSVTPIDPMIGILKDNGGPTWTHALLAGSTAIDKGKSFGLVTDQRGLIRPADLPGISNDPSGDGSDIGAFELQPKLENIFKNGFE